jgi:hypothetical protein
MFHNTWEEKNTKEKLKEPIKPTEKKELKEDKHAEKDKFFSLASNS